MGAENEKIPPYDEAAEAGVLGSMLIASRAADIAIGELKAKDFYLPRHQKLFDAFSDIYRAHHTLDEIFVISELAKRNGFLADIGGKETVGNLIMATPAAAQIETYCQIVKDKAQARALIQAMHESLKDCHNGQLQEATARLAQILMPKGQDLISTDNMAGLLTYDTETDPNNLLGDRWLCRAQALLLVSQSGVGKSSLGAQMSMTWALGKDLFGIQPVRPLKSLIVQSENDKGDLAEMVKGVANGLQFTKEELKTINDSVLFITDATHVGKDFIHQLHILARRHTPDLIFIDPLLAFLGGDVSKQEDVSRFCRNGGLQDIAADTGVAFVILHHTPKPAQDKSIQIAMTLDDYSYLGIGSSDLTNWVRAIMVIRAEDDNLYKLQLAKRKDRAGLKATNAPDSPSVNHIYLKHAQGYICWQRDELTETDQIKNMTQHILDTLEADKPYSKVQIAQLICKSLRSSMREIYRRGSIQNKVFIAIVEALYNSQSTGTLTKPSQTKITTPTPEPPQPQQMF